MLVYAQDDPRIALGAQPELDRDAALQFARTLFPSDKLELLGETDLWSTCPPRNEIHVGQFPRIAVVAAKEFGIDHPSRLPRQFLEAIPARNIYLHAMHSVVDRFAYAHWVDARLVRSLSVSPDSGVLEDIGARLPFEEPYWSGQHPVIVDERSREAYPLPFHPLDLGDAAMFALFGYRLEGFTEPAQVTPESIRLLRLGRSGTRWKFWR